MENNLIDEKSREKIINELDKNFFVEAGAGSGKTYCLVERMVNLIKQDKAKIENIAAVTFTRKAAAELKERFQIRLEESANQSLTEIENNNVRDALSNLEQIFTGTIHSFCAKILRERSVEAGVDPGFEEIEEEEDSIYAENVWPDFIENSHSVLEDKVFDFMEEYDISPNDLKDTYKKFIQYPDVEIVMADVPKPDFSTIKKAIIEFVESFRKVMPKKVPDNGWDELQKILKRAFYFIDNGYLNRDNLFIKLLNVLNKTANVTQNRWPDGNGKLYGQKMEEFQNEIIKPSIKKWQEYFHKPLASFAKKGADYYEQWRKNHSILNFQDLLTITSNLLRNNSEVRAYFKKRFSHLLVDEFQDTDPIQAEIILFLTGADIKEMDWKSIRPEPGALFLVGDPKQSIYRFRRADIDIYNTVKKIFKNDGTKKCDRENDESRSEVLDLYSNFRSLPFMRDVIEEVFMGVLPEEENRYQAKYFPLKTVRAENKKYDYGLFENNIKKIPKNNAAEVAKIDAEIIAGWIDFAVNGGLKLERTRDEIKSGLTEKTIYSDFLILSRKRENLGLYAKELEKKGIPYDIAGGKIFNASLELAEILKLFKAIEDVKDPVALVTVLRGLFFGLSDDMLYKFSVAGGRFSYYSKIPEGFQKFEEAYARLREFKDIVNKYEPLVAAEIILEKLGIVPLAVSEEEGLTRVGNIYKALEMLRDYKREEIELFFDLTRNLEELLKIREVESMSILASKNNAVRLMNLHKAKGLEAPIVILADPMGEAKEFEPDLHINRTDTNESKGYFTIFKSTSSFSRENIGLPPDWDNKSEEEKKYDRAERKRLEYVAVTRAKNILVVSTYREGSKAKAWEILYDCLKNAPKLEVKSSDSGKEMEIIHVSKSEWEKEKEQIADNINYISKSSYSLNNVTSEAKEGYVFSASGSGEGKGIEWGKIAHKTIEMICRGNDDKVKVMAKKWTEDAGLDKKYAEDLVALADKFKDSDIIKRINKAGKKYFEVPFAYKEDNNIMHGVIDLVFQENNQWVIVDYKTDNFEADIERKLIYQKQVGIYKDYWEKISGEKVAETILYKL